ncbi:hypothetical protein VaNZ11_003732 [Volvox africanus]|uniref:ATP-dependent helicase HrpB n=1 Tax=Volvox africanus TaxID=51714 RepID=A0ABQ5RUR0_9CHLO|nr:hypothetical protein VaNZ11_003732 [Volvox africanus]
MRGTNPISRREHAPGGNPSTGQKLFTAPSLRPRAVVPANGHTLVDGANHGGGSGDRSNIWSSFHRLIRKRWRPTAVHFTAMAQTSARQFCSPQNCAALATTITRAQIYGAGGSGGNGDDDGGGNGGLRSAAAQSTWHWGLYGRYNSIPRCGASAAASGAAAAAAATSSTAPLDPAVLKFADGLPIRECLEEVLTGLDRSNGLVLQAPPGAGKTTVIPLALLRHSPDYLRSGERILVLEPRRVAAKGAARRMAAVLQEPVGGTVGYRVRLDSKVSSSTRIEVATEGILLRRLQSDPELAGVGVVVFDEFHERNLNADLALALCLDVQRLARPDLRLVVMSATLGGGLGDRVRGLMAAAAEVEGEAGGNGSFSTEVPPLVISEGRSYPVKTVYLGRPGFERGALERAVADAVASAMRARGGAGAGDAPGGGGGTGDVLVFLPGVGEIRTVERLLQEDGTARKYDARVLQLHGNMAPDEQDEVLGPATGGPNRRRRVILSSPIAESSVTIDGVTAVVDSGLRRAPRYDTATAINRLDTILISEASADQRRGRAGRTAPGRCYRLWDERDTLPVVSEPEILTSDLAPAALELALWGSPDGRGLPWLDEPPLELLSAGRELLQGLRAVDPVSGRPTGHGRVLARLGVHPRWGHAVLRGAELGCAELAAVVATMLGSERDVLRRAGGEGGTRSADVMLRLEALAADDAALDRAAASRILQGARSMAAMATATVRRTAAANAKDDHDADDVAMAAALLEAGVGPLESGEASEAEGDDSADAVDADADLDRSSTSEGTTRGPADSIVRAASSISSSSGGENNSSADVGISSGGGKGEVNSGGRSGGVSAQSFDSRWQDQLLREGLVGALVAAAYPDRIAERSRRPNSRPAFTLSTGQVVRLPSEDDPLGQFEYLAVAEIGGVGPAAGWRRGGGGAGGGGGARNDTVRAAAGLTSLAIERYLSDMVQERDVVFWASGSKSVLARRQKRLGCLVLAERQVPATDAAALPALLQGFKEMGGVRGVGLSRELEAWRQRVMWLRTQAQAAAGPPGRAFPASTPSVAASSSSSSSGARLAALPDLSDGGLLSSAARWLGPHLAGARSKADMMKLDWNTIIKSQVQWDLRQLVEAEAPSHLQLPTGTRVLVDYSGAQPLVRCRLQEVFGLPSTPLLAGGRVPLTLELLSPAGRPAAVTSDLASFWRNSYPEVRRELRGRYPKHVWPEDPLQADATRLTKKQLEAQNVAAAALPTTTGVSSAKAALKKGSGSGKKK